MPPEEKPHVAVLRCRRTGSWGLLLALLLTFSDAAPARENQAGDATAEVASARVALATGRIDADLLPIADAFADWMAARVEAANGAPGLSDAVRHSRASQASRTALTPREATRLQLASSKQAGATHALVLDLDLETHEVELTIRAYDLASGELVAGSTQRGPVSRLAVLGNEALRASAEAVGLDPIQLRVAASLEIEDLASRSRALRAIDRGLLANAWRELNGQKSERADALRAKIQKLARNAPATERARLLAASGQPDEAWTTLTREAAAELRAPRPTPQLLLAVAEVQFARGQSTEAGKNFARALALDPDNRDALLGRARIQSIQGKTQEARRSLETAARLDPASPRPYELLADLSSRDRAGRARALLRAGQREARGFGANAARKQLGAAVRLEPKLEAEAQEELGTMLAKLGDTKSSAQSYQRAIEVGGESPGRLRGLAEAQLAQGDPASARASLERAVALDDADPNLHRDLGIALDRAGDPQQAIVSLERAVALEPGGGKASSDLARVLRTQGQEDRALELLEHNDSRGLASARDLRAKAEILRSRGEAEAATDALERAVELRPDAAELRVELAEIHEESGHVALSARQRAMARALEADPAKVAAEPYRGADKPGGAPESAGPAEPVAPISTTALQPLVASFQPEEMDEEDEENEPVRVAFLGVRERLDRRGMLLDWLVPKTIDIAKLELHLAGAIETSYQLVAAETQDSYTKAATEDVFAFDREVSLSPRAITATNVGLGTDAVFVAELIRGPGGPRGYVSVCGGAPFFQIELRRLSGYAAEEVEALANVACLPGGLATYTTWNYKAASVYTALLLLLLAICVRGWGSIVVGLKLPPNTKALFSISASRRPRRLKSRVNAAAPAGRAKTRIEQSLRTLDLRERRFRQGQPTIFRWLAARRRPYHVTVRGPLLDYLSDELVGDFLEEKTVFVKRGKTTHVEFDMRPQECALQVNLRMNDQPVEWGIVACRGSASSVRYTSRGSTFLYLKEGRHIIVAGSEDRVAERDFEIDHLEAQQLPIDLGAEDDLLFSGCPDAVAPYVEGDYDTAASALAAAGIHETAQLVRALGLEERGDIAAASEALVAAGRAAEAAEMLSDAGDHAAAAPLFEEAADYRRAADSQRAAGDLARAAALYKLDHSYDEAVECFREVGDRPGLLEVLELNCSYFEAGTLAEDLGDSERAILNFQRVDPQSEFYVSTCLRLAALLAVRGEIEPAIERYDEATGMSGAEEIPAAAVRQHAELLERVGRLHDAMTAYERLSDLEDDAGDCTARIEVLRKKIQTEGPVAVAEAPAPDAVAAPAAPPQPQESRYEILSELGRGGMGVVYKARDRHLGRVVALKRLTENLAQHPTAVSYFEREARAAAALNHPNIVTVYDAGQENGSYFISMEFMEGTPLDVILEQRGALQPGSVARLGQHVATGLAYAHQNKIIHRDIKTANLFFTKDKIVKIMDFGLAKMVEEVRRASTIIAGTPYYMSPEQSEGDNPDHRADLYSLGVTLFQLLTGRVPFHQGDVTYHHRHTPAPDPRELVPEVPAVLAELILGLMAKAREDRIQSADEVAARLQAMLAR